TRRDAERSAAGKRDALEILAARPGRAGSPSSRLCALLLHSPRPWDRRGDRLGGDREARSGGGRSDAPALLQGPPRRVRRPDALQDELGRPASASKARLFRIREVGEAAGRERARFSDRRGLSAPVRQAPLTDHDEAQLLLRLDRGRTASPYFLDG